MKQFFSGNSNGNETGIMEEYSPQDFDDAAVANILYKIGEFLWDFISNFDPETLHSHKMTEGHQQQHH